MKRGVFFHCSWVFFCSVIFSLVSFASDPVPKANQEAKTKVYRQGSFVVKQYVSPGFDRLPLDRKNYVYFLSRAIQAGRDIDWEQNSRYGLRIRNLLEYMWRNSSYYSHADKALLGEYFFRVLRNHGNYEKQSNQKFIPEGLTWEKFLSLLSLSQKQAQKKKIKFDFTKAAEELKAVIFDPSYLRVMNATDGDLIADSNTNYYGTDVTLQDIEELPLPIKNHFLSYPFKNQSGQIELQLHKVGGRFHKELTMVAFYLKRAREYANEQEKQIIDAYIESIFSGDPKDLRKAEVLWVQYKPVDIDFQMGFIEDYIDPLGKRGEWEGMVFLKNLDQETIKRIEAIRGNADYFEAQMPVDSQYKKTAGFTPPQAEGAFILFSGGANGETPFSGVNLPNPEEIKDKYGSKSYTALNVIKEIGTGTDAVKEGSLNTFYLPKYRELLKEFSEDLLDNIQVEFHEILGHGSGQSMQGVTNKDLKEYFNPLEEGRAETASLYHVMDKRIRDFGILPKDWDDAKVERFATAMIVDFFTRQLRSYNKLPSGAAKIKQAHQWGRQVMLNRMLSDGALKVVLSEAGVPLIELISLEKARESLGIFWAEIQKAKSEGDYATAKQIYETWGFYREDHQNWRAGIVKAMENLNIPKEAAFMNPKFSFVLSPEGKLTDIKLVYETGAHGIDVFMDRHVALTSENRQISRICKTLLEKRE